MENKKIFRYETHCHTSPVSGCAKSSAEDTVRFYKAIGYDGIFITNHFLDGNINKEARSLPYEEQVDYYFSDYEKALAEGKRTGLKVFPGVELSYGGTDFLIYGPEPSWYRAHPEIMKMSKTEELKFMAEAGAFIAQAHPYREDFYIDHIRLYPRCVHAAEVINSNQSALANEMAGIYAEKYGLLRIAGSDNHRAEHLFEDLERKGRIPEIAGMYSETPVCSVEDFIRMMKTGEMKPFVQTAGGDWKPV